MKNIIPLSILLLTGVTDGYDGVASYKDGQFLTKYDYASGLPSESFSLLERASGCSVLTRPIRREKTGLGEFQVLDFTEMETPGEYTIKAGELASQPFRIGPDVWERTARMVINFFYAERCGYAVPRVHDVCHQDWQAHHLGQTITINGGWHDAGDLSQLPGTSRWSASSTMAQSTSAF